MKKFLCLVLLFLCSGAAALSYEKAPAAKGPINPPNRRWTATIERLAPERPTAEPKTARRVLLFSVATGYYHAVIPHTDAVVKILGERTGAFKVVQSDDIEMFTPEKLKEFDAVVLNNTCPIDPGRNLFLDVLQGKTRDKQLGAKYKSLTEKQRKTRAAELEKNLIDYVASGRGLVCIHGGITILNNSPAFSEMIGGSFDFHPRLQEVTLDLVEPGHPLVAGFQGKGFLHVDEPYLFNGAYPKKNFRPLLRMNVEKLDKAARSDPRVTGDVRYVAWIKPYGKGRVFYAGPSHQPESFETAGMLRFLLDGIQYALGDLKCDDATKSRD
ncbi:MAG TPA: ThuA domain-containing protein [Thermoguttaceae bacterium]|nr:ThuA domain-containing protein [Thermoguttaceae bacterium]